jgi:hypothetical protein
VVYLLLKKAQACLRRFEKQIKDFRKEGLISFAIRLEGKG